MALKLKQAGLQPLGQFDGYDSDYTTILGGEIGFFQTVIYKFPGSADLGAYDAFDGYAGFANYGTNQSWVRPAISHTFSSAALGGLGDTSPRPLFLLDEGQIGYGTMFGYVVGGVVGQVVPNPSNVTTTNTTVLGPTTALASGKVTCWDKPGLYSITLDAVDPAITPGALNSGAAALPGAPVYFMSTGKLTFTAGSAWNGVATSNIVGRFVEFATSGALVTTPNYLANPPVAGSAGQNWQGFVRKFTEMVISFRIE